MGNSRTKIYLEGHHILAPHLREYADALTAVDYDVCSDWHDGAIVPLVSELIISLSRCDLLIVWLAGASQDSWVKVGWAMASGMRVVFVGGAGQIPASFESIVQFRFDTWEDLARDDFARLGSTRFKKVGR
jgi:hypothetical protein